MKSVVDAPAMAVWSVAGISAMNRTRQTVHSEHP